MSVVFTGKKGAGTITLDLDRVVIGTRSSCHLTVEDPLMAEEHLAVHKVEGGYAVEDLGSSSGSYLNGQAVEGRVRLPEEGPIAIVLGVSRLTGEWDKEKGVLAFKLKEGAFFYDKKADPLAWTKAEVDFGRFGSLRVANLAAGGAGLLLLGLALVPGFGGRMVDPGPVYSRHEEAVVQWLAEGRGEDRCDACHETFAGAPPARCADCHAAIVEGAVHPPGWDGRSCQPCHVDHRGVDKASLMPSVPTPATCEGCHDVRAMASWATKSDWPEAVPAATVRVPLAYDAFPHAAHLAAAAQGRGVTCTTCHVPAPEGRLAPEVPGINGRQFARLSFESCQGCHDSEKGRITEKRFAVAWHGTDGDGTHCLECHQSLHEKPLRMVDRVPGARPGRAFALTTRDHAAESVHRHAATGRECRECHRDLRFGGTATTLAFRHFSHLSDALPAAGARVPVEAECRACHTDLEAARHLAAPVYRGPPAERCGKCHTGGAPELVPDRRAPRPVPDFPHSRHWRRAGRLEQGCFACHALEAGVAGAFDATVATPERIATCTECHTAHEQVGGGSCKACHPAGDPVYLGPKAVLPTRPWPAANPFDHRSPGHEDVACTTCHTDLAGDAPGVTSLAKVRLPVESDESCRTCHVRERARFHWR